MECVAKRESGKKFFSAHSSLRRPHYLNAWNRLFGLRYVLLPHEHGTGRRDEALRSMRGRLGQTTVMTVNNVLPMAIGNPDDIE